MEGKKKAVLKLFIYRHKKPCCRTFSNYEDFLQCIKIKDSLKIIALGSHTHMLPICMPVGTGTHRPGVSARSAGRGLMLAPTEKSRRRKLKPNPRVAGSFLNVQPSPGLAPLPGDCHAGAHTALRESSPQTNTRMRYGFSCGV